MATEAEKNARIEAAIRTWRGEVRRVRSAWDQVGEAALSGTQLDSVNISYTRKASAGLLTLLLATAELAVVVVEVEEDIDP